MASRLRPLPIAALVLATVIGIALAIHLDRVRRRVATISSAVASASSAAPTASVEREVQLHGHILTANGDPVSGAHVRVLAQAHVVSETTTDAGGRFAFDRLASGSVRVEADHDPEGAVDSAEITISNVATEITLVLVPAGIHGVVIDGENGHFIEGAAISFAGAPFSAAGATSDAAGEFHIAVVPFEATAVVAVAGGYRTARVTLGPREDRPELALRIALRSAPPVEGDVVDQDGKPVQAHVVACEGQPFEARVDSGDDGAFRLPPSSVGCDAYATHDELGPSEPVAIVEGRHVTLRLGAAGAIAGFAVDERGRSIDSFSVGVETFVPARGNGVERDPAGAFKDGVFRLEKLVPGSYVLTAVTAGKPPTRSSPIVVRSGAVTDNVKIVIAPGGVIEGRVLDEQHAPLADVELRFDMVSLVAGSDAVTKTDASGHYRLEGAPAGPFTVSAQKAGYRHKLVSALTVSSGSSITKDISLTKANGGVELTGIGATLAASGNGIKMAGVESGDPADRVGLQAGDRIVRIDGEEIVGLSLVDAIQRLRGEPGTVVGVTVERGGETLDVAITRGVLIR